MEERIAIQLVFKEKTQIRRGLYSKYQCSEGQGMQFSRGAGRLFANPTTSGFDQERLPKLSGGVVAVIKFGGSWKSARRESVIMILNATRVAVDEGTYFFQVAKKSGTNRLKT
jgi:hypothetical protein